MKIKLPDYDGREEINRCVAIAQMIQDGKTLGIQEGKILGINQGRQSELQEVCCSLFQMGTDESTIATLLHMRGLDGERANELMNKYRQVRMKSKETDVSE